jgi:hypothetical protein
MNRKTPYVVFCSTFWENLASLKEDGEDYTFDSFFSLLIRAQEKFYDGGKLSNKKHAHSIERKSQYNYKERGQDGNQDKVMM